MKQLRILTALLFVTIFAMGDGGVDAVAAGKEKTVWICGGPKSKRYHSSRNCAGLRKCSVNPRQVSYNDAVKMGYTPCKKCY